VPMDLYSIGEMVIDFPPGSEPASYIRNAGGAPVNAAIALVKSGLTAGVCCSVGDDDFGRFLMDTLREYNVRVLNPRLCREAVTTMAFVTLYENGDRSFVFARKPGADMFLREEDVREEDIREALEQKIQLARPLLEGSALVNCARRNAKSITAQAVHDAVSGEVKNAGYDAATGTIMEMDSERAH